MLEFEVHEIRGKCPVYKKGDKIVVDDPEIVLEKTDARTSGKFDQNASPQTFRKSLIKNLSLRYWAEYEWSPVKLGLTTEKDPDHAYLPCLDPGEPYTEGGTVIFKCRRIERR